MTKVDYNGSTPATPDVTLEYDRLGRPTDVTDATGSRAFAHGRRSGFAATGLSTLTNFPPP